jgi:hypothetical protein
MPSTIRPSVCHAWHRRHVEVSGPQLRVLSVDDNSNSAHALAAYLSFENIGVAWLMAALKQSRCEPTGRQT